MSMANNLQLVLMPKAARKKYYAVRRGREGPKIYESWDETKLNISRYPAAAHKSFTSRSQAEAWIRVAGLVPYSYRPPPTTAPESNEMIDILRARNARSNSLNNPTPPQPQAPPKPPPAPARDAQDTPPAGPELPLSPEIKLSPEQQQVLNKVKAGGNVFFTGSAGTGKSVLLREIIKWCRETKRELAVTASTGIASVNIGGSTLHSWAGIGLGKEDKEKLAMKILGQDKYQRMKKKQQRRDQGLPSDDEDYESDQDSQPRVIQRWRKCQTLIIDEISMIDGKLFEKLDYIARVLRRNNAPFGGIQLVLSGDFCQLPPVPDRDARGAPIPATFAFDAECWDECVGKPICLKKVFRQKDQEFVNMLNQMRFGELSPEAVQAFKRLARRVEYDDDIEPTDLFSKRYEVDRANNQRLAQLKTKAHVYEARDIPGYDSNGRRLSAAIMVKVLERLVAQQTITLKEGAQVMLVKNMIQGRLVNGSIGKVTGFLPTREALQRGIKLGLAEGTPRNKPPSHMGPKIKPIDQPDVEVPVSLLNSPQLWPVVKFNHGSLYGGPIEVLCVPDRFEVNNADGGVEATREQVPLILAWALSIHKSQGQTLERVRVDLGSVFEKGQAYVALSRATSMRTLEVRNFDPAKVMAHPRVLEWMRANTNLHVPVPLVGDVDEDEQEYWADP